MQRPQSIGELGTVGKQPKVTKATMGQGVGRPRGGRGSRGRGETDLWRQVGQEKPPA